MALAGAALRGEGPIGRYGRQVLARIAFDGRYINDRYHGIGRVAYSLLEALVRLGPKYEFIVFVHPGYPNTRFPLRRLSAQNRVRFHPIRLPLLLPIEQLAWPLLLARERADLFHSPYVVGPV